MGVGPGLAVVVLVALHLLVIYRINLYHQRVIKVKSASWLFLAFLGAIVGAFGLFVWFKDPSSAHSFRMVSGLSLGLSGAHLLNTMLLKV